MTETVSTDTKLSGSSDAGDTAATTAATKKQAAASNGSKKAIHLRLGGFVGKKGGPTTTGSGTDSKKPEWTHEKVSFLNFIFNLSIFLLQISLEKQVQLLSI